MYGLNSYSRVPYAGLGTVYTGSVSESIIAETDSEIVIATFITAITEAISAMSDFPVYTGVVSITENLTSNDVNAGVGNFVGSISEPTNFADINSVIANFVSIISESNTLNDSVIGGWNVSLTENSTLSDLPTGFGTFVFSIIENISNFGDKITQTGSFPVTILEAISSLTDNSLGLPTFAVSVSEGSTIANTQIGGWNVSVLENSSIIDNKTVIAAFVSSITENLNPADKPTTIAAFNSIINESFAINDLPLGGGWFIINDNQTITWVSLDDTQTPNWTNTNNSQ